jgi:hypothetical protein
VVTLRGKPYENEHGRPLSMPIRRRTGRYKETKFYRIGNSTGRVFDYYEYARDLS